MPASKPLSVNTEHSMQTPRVSSSAVPWFASTSFTQLGDGACSACKRAHWSAARLPLL